MTHTEINWIDTIRNNVHIFHHKTFFPSYFFLISSKINLNSTRKIVSFFIPVDECDRLWIVDSGLSDLFGQTKKFQDPLVYIFDLKTSKLIRRFVIPEKQKKADSFFVNIVS